MGVACCCFAAAAALAIMPQLILSQLQQVLLHIHAHIQRQLACNEKQQATTGETNAGAEYQNGRLPDHT
jgi:hypothetical protein